MSCLLNSECFDLLDLQIFITGVFQVRYVILIEEPQHNECGLLQIINTTAYKRVQILLIKTWIDITCTSK